MKIRNGFVSNSSSSSFILAYNNRRVTTDPREIIRVLQEKPDTPVIIKGWDLGEGDDIFELSEQQKSCIRKFSDEFIRRNDGEVTRERYVESEDGEYHWENVTEPKIIAYIGGELFPLKEFGWGGFNSDEEEKEAYRKDKEETTNRAFEFLKSRQRGDDSNLQAESVNVSNRSCKEDYYDCGEFFERYFTLESLNDYEESFHMRKYSKLKEHAYAIFYKSIIQDKERIMEWIEDDDTFMKSGPHLIGRYNRVFNEGINLKSLDLYTLAEKERASLILGREDFLNNNNEYILFIDAFVVEGGANDIPAGYNITLDYGNLYLAEAGGNIPDFKKTIICKGVN